MVGNLRGPVSGHVCGAVIRLVPSNRSFEYEQRFQCGMFESHSGVQHMEPSKAACLPSTSAPEVLQPAAQRVGTPQSQQCNWPSGIGSSDGKHTFAAA